jgi:hypothetical protein
MTSKTLFRLLTIALALGAGSYFIGYAAGHIRDLPPLSWGWKTWVLLGVSILLWSGIIALGALIWKILLNDLNCRLNWYACVTIFGIAQFGKYLPGNVAQYAGRVMLAKQAGVPASSTLQTMLFEMIWGVGVASGIALIGVILGRNIGASLVTLTLFFIAALLSPRAGWSVANIFFPKLVARLTDGGHINLPGLRTLLLVSMLYLATFVVIGFVIDIHARFLFGTQSSHIFMLTVIYAWAWIAGYITIGAPAGLGVREAVLVSTLTPIYGASVAVGLTISLRVVTTLGDLTVFLIAMLLSRFKHSYDQSDHHSKVDSKSVKCRDDK